MDSRGNAFLLLAPACIPLLVLSLGPLIVVVFASLVHWTIFSDPQFAGVANFATMMGDSYFINALTNTLLLLGIAGSLEVGLGIAVAVLLESWPRFINLFRLILGLPLVMSPILVGCLWRVIFDDTSGFLSLDPLRSWIPIRPLSSTRDALLGIAIADLWQWTPFVALFLSFALEQTKRGTRDLLAADRIRFVAAVRHVWIPLILPVILTVALLRIVDILRVFDLVQAMTAGGPGNSSEVLALFTYRQLVTFGNFGYSAVVALVILVIASVLLAFGAKLTLRFESVQ